MSDAEGIDQARALKMANGEASKRYGEHMLMFWYDLDWDYESPPNTSKGPEGSPKDGYVHCALNRGTKLREIIDSGRFVFFYMPV